MAKQTRSVWEIRFYALQQFIGFNESALRNQLAQAVIDGATPKMEYVHQCDVLGKLKKKSNEIETARADRIFLLRDI